MHYFIKQTICTVVLVSFFNQFTVAQSNLIPDSNLHRYQSLKSVLGINQDIATPYTQPLNDTGVRNHVYYHFSDDNISCTRAMTLPNFPFLIINVTKPVIGGSMGLGRPPAELCQVSFSVIDKLAGRNAVM